MTAPSRSAFAAPNYRRYFFGQMFSVTGVWIQMTAQAWMVWRLSYSGTMLGLVVACEALPLLLIGPYAGVLIDRSDKRRLITVTQALLSVPPIVLGILAQTGTIRLWMVFVFAIVFGLIGAIDGPARSAFAVEMVGSAGARSAMGLSAVLWSVARAVGPAIAGIFITTVGAGACFLLNGFSYFAILGALISMNPADLHRAEPVARGRHQLREGLRHVAVHPTLLSPLLVMAVVGLMAYSAGVYVPLLAESTFHGGAQSLAILMSSLGVGATAGGLLAARGHGRSRVGVEGAAGLFGVALILAAVAPSVALEAVALALVGLASVTFQTTTSTALQVGTDPEYRGRVMALWLVAFVGTTPLGGPATGFIAQLLGIRASVAIAGASCFLAAGIGAAILRRNLDRIGGARDDRVLGSPAVPGCNTAERPKDIAT